MSDNSQIDQTAIGRIMMTAIETLYMEHLDILRLDVAERTICAELAAILKPHFAKHAVHTEYNRHGVEPKEIDLPDAQGVLTGSRVSPDIIVHQPGHDGENILVIEAKKTTNPVPDEPDLTKLAHIKRQIGYRFAAFLRLPAGAAANPQDVRITWI